MTGRYVQTEIFLRGDYLRGQLLGEATIWRGIHPGSKLPRGNYPAGKCLGEIILGGNCPEGNNPRGQFSEGRGQLFFGAIVRTPKMDSKMKFQNEAIIYHNS